jgi:hypothetical protein
MRHRAIVAVTLLSVSVIGVSTIGLAFSSELPPTTYVLWWLFLVLVPLVLACFVMVGWTWPAMASVVYGTIGLALDLSTLAPLVGGLHESGLKVILSLFSGCANFFLIVFGGRAFWSALEGRRPPESRPPSPPSPSSS